MAGDIHVKRIYEPKAAADGLRVLVDRLWPRGVTKAAAAVDVWMRDVAPSSNLRRWFDHKPDRWEEFQQRYRNELAGNLALVELRRLAAKSNVTLLYAAKDQLHNQAVVLADVMLSGQPAD